MSARRCPSRRQGKPYGGGSPQGATRGAAGAACQGGQPDSALPKRNRQANAPRHAAVHSGQCAK
eukprot:6108629-Alexandrium_andersonii.AAC.1